MDCKHELKYIVGIAGGVKCTNCGQFFDHIPKQDAPEVKAEPRKAPAKRGGVKRAKS